ncbi:hypothetical protein [Rickettsia helvetica]|uniref:hypothetical protein n=1 Tax=Rickettsia helvetica TaxID=35789 RepID=UPI00028912FB|nr:hypothetical protein [Rickettsia endosymbiont of Ixodes ricinus]MCZ6896761.1 hypothetical protein [Rickettsia endosymbiont of Ixodes ricinus]
MKYLSEHLKQSNLSHLNLDSNIISNCGMRYLSDHLKDSCLTSISLKCNNIDNNGVQYLARTLKDTQIIEVNFGNIDMGYRVKTAINEAVSENKVNTPRGKPTAVESRKEEISM